MPLVPMKSEVVETYLGHKIYRADPKYNITEKYFIITRKGPEFFDSLKSAKKRIDRGRL